MAKTLSTVAFDPGRCKTELAAFKGLLDSKPDLAERSELQPFFKANTQLAAFIGTHAPNIGPATHLAFEFPFLGNYSADIVLGNKEVGEYCVIELEDGTPDSIFKTVAKKANTEWSPRFEHGFSQLVDWCYTLDDFKNTKEFQKTFGYGYVTFHAILILGRSAGVSASDRDRLKWRSEKVRIDSHAVSCITFDDLYDQLNLRLRYYPEAVKAKEKPG